MNMVRATYFDNPLVARMKDLAPGDLFKKGGITYKVLRIARNVEYQALHDDRTLHGHVMTAGSKSQEKVEVVGHFDVLIQHRKKKWY